MGVENTTEEKKKRGNAVWRNRECSWALPPVCFREKRTIGSPASDIPEILCLPLNILPFFCYFGFVVFYSNLCSLPIFKNRRFHIKILDFLLHFKYQIWQHWAHGNCQLKNRCYLQMGSAFSSLPQTLQLPILSCTGYHIHFQYLPDFWKHLDF